MSIPLVPALSLALLSFICSVFVILRIIVPILPPNPLSRRVPPSEFGLPNFRSLSVADKTHVWLASLDLLALAIFVWQAVDESLVGPSQAGDALDPFSSGRLWFSLTVRQTCLLLVAGITLLHVRTGQPVSFGEMHWMLWSPTLLVAVFSTAMAVALAGANIPSLFIGLFAYSAVVAVLSTIAFGCLLSTLVVIKRNLAALHDRLNPWPPMRQEEERPRPSFSTEDIDALRDGASWITSNASSRRQSVSAWSFSTHRTVSQQGFARTNPATASHPSIPAKSSFWFNPATPYAQHNEIPPVPPLPSPYRAHSPQSFSVHDPDPFRCEVPTPYEHQRLRHGSQTSWLTSPSASQVTLSAWSYPTSVHQGDDSPDAHVGPMTPFSSVQVLGGYGFAARSTEVEKGISVAPGHDLDVSIYRTLPWFVIIWLPLSLSLPYLIAAFPNVVISSPVFPILLVLSVTISSPLLALNLLFRYPIPIPSGLFESSSDLPRALLRTPSIACSLPGLPSEKFSHEYKRSSSATVVGGRRSDDVWIANGDAVDGKSKIGRALGMMVPKPRLAILPPTDTQDGDITPPLPMQNEDSTELAVTSTPPSEKGAEMSRVRKDSKASSYYSSGDDSIAFASHIMVAQRHYSAMAQTVVVPASPDRREFADAGKTLDVASATGVTVKQTSGPSTHLRTRSVSSINNAPQRPATNRTDSSPPPSFPLPPTPPNVRAARLARLGHKKSFSSGFSFGAVDDVNEIDALTAGVLPLLVPGLIVGTDMRVKDPGLDGSPPVSLKKASQKSSEFGGLEDDGQFSSPQVHSTPARGKVRVGKDVKVSRHGRNHFSLPSLGLGKDGNWKVEISRALENHLGKFIGSENKVEPARRNTVLGNELSRDVGKLHAVQEEGEYMRSAKKQGRILSTRSLGLTADVPQNVDTARSSITTLSVVPPSAASTVTLFNLEGGPESCPDAESTPHHNALTGKQPSNFKYANKNTGRSSIVYIKSDDAEYLSPTNPDTTTIPSNSSGHFAQWSSRAVRPLLQRQNLTISKTGSLHGGLRPLSLLKDRDINTITEVYEHGGTPPLSVRTNRRIRSDATNDENAGVESGSRNGGLKPLQLVRSETSKMRGILRRGEVLPEVVVRPPSSGELENFTYTFAI